MNESIKIIVTLTSGKKFDKTVTIRSMGAYIEVNEKVNDLVAKEWKSFNISNISWSYA